MRLGVLKSFSGQEDIHAPVNKVFDTAIEKLKAAGMEIVEVEENYDAADLQGNRSVDAYEFKEALNGFFGSHDSLKHLKVEELIEQGKVYKSIKGSWDKVNALSTQTDQYRAVAALRDALGPEIIELMDRYAIDALIFPHQKRLAVKVGESQLDRNGILGSLTGFPALAVPGGFSPPEETAPLGVPAGIEILGRPFDDGRILAIGKQIEQIIGGRKAPDMKLFENEGA